MEGLARPEITLLSSGDPRIFPSCELWYDTIRLQLNRAKVKMRFFTMHYACMERNGSEGKLNYSTLRLLVLGPANKPNSHIRHQ